MAMPKRIDTHEIDTLAYRKMITGLPASWIERTHTDRDYGIDLQFELFNASVATGGVAFVQLKGKNKAFPKRDAPKLGGFPTKTVDYALLFDIPFFVFHTSVTDGETYFVWLQKYARMNFDTKSASWRTKASVTIEFPKQNVLSSNRSKIENIVADSQLLKTGLEFLAIDRQLRLHAPHVIVDQPFVSVFAAKLVDQLLLLPNGFYAKFTPHTVSLDLLALRTAFKAIGATQATSRPDALTIVQELSHLKAIRDFFLNFDDLETFQFTLDNDFRPY
jgi:hypothetical protein